MRCVGFQGKDARIDHRIADQPLGRRPVEAGFVGRAADRGELAPGVVIVTHRAMDLRRHRERAGARGGEEQRDRVALLHPAIGIDPEVEVEAREVARQEGACRERLVAVLQLVATGKIEIPLRHDQGGTLPAAPGALLPGETAIEHAERQRASLGRRAQRGDAIAHQLEIAGVAAGDRDGSFRHVVRMAHRHFAVACHCATVRARRKSWPSTSTITFH